MPVSMLVHQFLENSATLRPEKLAVIENGRRTNYRDVDRQADAVAGFLVGQGLQPGDRICLLCENSLEYIVGYYGILKTGCVAVPLSSDLKPSGLKSLLEDVDASVVITTCRFERLLLAVDWTGLSVRLLLVSNPRIPENKWPIQTYAWEEISGSSKIHQNGTRVNPDDLAAIIYTSGSTGRPKGVMLSHENIAINTQAICTYLELTSEDIQMVVLPFFYVMGKSLLNTHFCVGGTVVINNKFAFPADVLKQMREEKVTGFSGVPSTYAYLLHRSPLRKLASELTTLRYCTQAGGHMSNRIKTELRQILPAHTRLIIMYGATEASARLTYLPHDRLTEKIDSIGIPIPGVSMYVADPNGSPVPDGDHGEIVASGRNIMKGYWQAPEETRHVLDSKGRYRTGDIGYRDPEGYFYIVGRKDGLIKVGGHRINPQEIEDKLMETGCIIESAVIGVPDALLGNKLVGLVVAKENEITSERIKQLLSEILPKYKLPSEVEFVRSLPKNASGKIDRAKCAQMCLFRPDAD